MKNNLNGDNLRDYDYIKEIYKKKLEEKSEIMNDQELKHINDLEYDDNSKNKAKSTTKSGALSDNTNSNYVHVGLNDPMYKLEFEPIQYNGNSAICDNSLGSLTTSNIINKNDEFKIFQKQLKMQYTNLFFIERNLDLIFNKLLKLGAVYDNIWTMALDYNKSEIETILRKKSLDANYKYIITHIDVIKGKVTIINNLYNQLV